MAALLVEDAVALVGTTVTGDGGDDVAAALLRGLGRYPREVALTWDNTD